MLRIYWRGAPTPSLKGHPPPAPMALGFSTQPSHFTKMAPCQAWWLGRWPWGCSSLVRGEDLPKASRLGEMDAEMRPGLVPLFLRVLPQKHRSEEKESGGRLGKQGYRRDFPTAFLILSSKGLSIFQHFRYKTCFCNQCKYCPVIHPFQMTLGFFWHFILKLWISIDIILELLLPLNASVIAKAL